MTYFYKNRDLNHVFYYLIIKDFAYSVLHTFIKFDIIKETQTKKRVSNNETTTNSKRRHFKDFYCPI